MHDQNMEIDYHATEQNHPALGSEPTQTIDLQDLFMPDVNQSGVFDLSDIGSTSFGKLLDALPVPVLLIDQWFCVSFVNPSCEKLGTNYRDIKGSRFTDLLPNLDDAARASSLRAKTVALLERVLSDRRPQRAEAILEIEKHKIWARLHLRSVRLWSDRLIMVIIEDVTSERTLRHVVQKDERALRQSLMELQNRVREVNRELSEAILHLQQETAQHEETKRQLKACLEGGTSPAC